MLKRWAAVPVLVLCLLPALCFSALADSSSTDMDVLLVIDVSGSMNNSDEERIALDGAKLFIDMMETSGSNAGILSFSTDVTEVYEYAPIDTNEEKEQIRASIDTLENGGDTDIGGALEEALSILSRQEDENKKAIVFFTDGKIDLPQGEPNEEEAEASSRQKAETAMEEAAEAGISIYTIGLNADGSLDQDLLDEIASGTGTDACHVVTSASELPGIFNTIFADLVDSGVEELDPVTISGQDAFTDVPFEIPNESVMEANLVLLTDDAQTALTEIQLTDPDGAVLIPDEDPDLSLSAADHYEMLKIIAPKAGTWTLQIKGDPGCEVHVNLLFNYEVELLAEGTEEEGGNLHIKAWLQKKEEEVSDEDLLSQLTVRAVLTRENGIETSFPMTRSGSSFLTEIAENSIQAEPGETVTVQVMATGANLACESEPFLIQISEEQETEPELETETEPETESEMEPLLLKKELPFEITLRALYPAAAKKTIDLDDYFASANEENQIVSYRAEPEEPAVASAELEGSRLTLRGKTNGGTFLDVQAEDAEGNTVGQDMIVEVRITFSSVLPLILIPAGVLLLLLLAVILLIRSRRGKMAGYLYWQLSEEGAVSSGDEERFDLTFAKKKASVRDLIPDLSLEHCGLDQIRISAAGDALLVRNKGRACVLYDANGEETKKTKLCDGNTIRAAFRREDGKKWVVEMRYQASVNDLDFGM